MFIKIRKEQKNMTSKEIKELIKTPEYDFLKTNEHLGNNIILLGLGGSHAYGTNIDTSDVDVRGVALNSKREILLTRDFESYVNEATDTTVYSFNKIIELLTNCNPNTIEMLGLDKEDYLYVTKEGQMLLDNKGLFLSRRCIQSFGGYANQQLYRLQQKSLCAVTEEQLNWHIAKVLSSMATRLNVTFGTNIDIIFDETKSDKDFSGIFLSGNIQNIPAEHIASALAELNNTIRDYKKHSHRNENAMLHGKIAKHAMHLIRLYMMCIDIMEKHEIVTKRIAEHDLLMDIRNGKYLDADGKPNSEFFEIFHEYEKRFDYAKENTDLPDKPDYDAINDFRASVNESVVCR